MFNGFYYDPSQFDETCIYTTEPTSIPREYFMFMEYYQHLDAGEFPEHFITDEYWAEMKRGA